MNKQQFFHRPATAGEILGNKWHVSRAYSGIAERIIEMNEHEGLIIPQLVPEEYEGRMKFLKRAPQVVLDVGASQFDAINAGTTPQDAHKKAMGMLKKDEQYCGMAWRSLRRNEFKRVTLDESIKGTKLFAWTEISGNPIEAKAYNDANVDFYGGKFKLWVPSRTPKHGRYEMTAESVPVRKSKFNPVIWTDLTATHYCGVTGNDFSYRYVKSEDFCAHTVAALEHLAKTRFVISNDRVPYDFIPFPMPTQETVEYYNKLVNNVMVEDEFNGKKRKRPLNKAEREILLWDFVKITGYDAAFGHKSRKFREYKWAA